MIDAPSLLFASFCRTSSEEEEEEDQVRSFPLQSDGTKRS
jgi:hypothetical protein